jgi:hypothetical protein
MYIFPTFGRCVVRSAEHFSKATVGAWINTMRQTKVRRGGGKPKDVSPETLRGPQGLLSSVLKEAVVSEPPLRDRNPCDLTWLLKDDDHGMGDTDGVDQMELMTRRRSPDWSPASRVPRTGCSYGPHTAPDFGGVRSPPSPPGMCAARHRVGTRCG